MHFIFFLIVSGDQENSSNVPNVGKGAATCAENRKSVKAKQFDEVLLLKYVAVEACKG